MPFRTRCLVALTVWLPAACTSPPDRPATSQVLPACGWLPNCVNSQSGHGLQAIEPLQATPQQWQRLKNWIARQDDWEITRDDGDFLQAVVKTPLMRFRDDVQLVFLPDQRVIEVRASSRLGLSDLGTNARRVGTLRDQLEAMAVRPSPDAR
jgi:uncharacterized protein (DUF1499 family)